MDNSIPSSSAYAKGDSCEDDRVEETTRLTDRTVSGNYAAVWTILPVHLLSPAVLHVVLTHEQMAQG